MSERAPERDSIARYDRRDPDPWLALYLDQALPIDDGAKAAILRCQASFCRRFLLPPVRYLSYVLIFLASAFRTVFPRWPHSSWALHRLMAWGMRNFLMPDANRLIIRHFNLGREILAFIASNAAPGFKPDLDPIAPKTIDDLKDDVFLKHDLNIYRFIIQLNDELARRGAQIERRPDEALDFSAITDGPEVAGPFRKGWLNFVDIQTAVTFYTPVYAFFLSDRDFWRAANSLQLDETIGMYVARLTGQEHYLGLVTNGHPIVPFSTLEAGFRLMLHGLATETLHGFLRRMKAAAEQARLSSPAPPASWPSPRPA
jgi:hypothetical protein